MQIFLSWGMFFHASCWMKHSEAVLDRWLLVLPFPTNIKYSHLKKQ